MVETKRFRFGERGEAVDMAGVLMLLSRGGGEISMVGHHHHKRVFECKTCSKQFSSFQALGGHRASHKKPRLSEDGRSQAQSAAARPKVHECSVCGLEFAIGQALGGHMRRHRVVNNEGLGLLERKSNGERMMSLDLNLAPPGDKVEHRQLGLGLELGLGLGLGVQYTDDNLTTACSH